MNILIPHQWLLEHLDTEATPAEIQKYLSLCGPSVERIYDREGDSVYDIEVTTNRVDSMSVRGIAREAAVILSQFGKRSKLKKLKVAKEVVSLKDVKPEGSKLPLPTIVDDSQLCKRTMCVVLANVKRAATPDWMAKRLLQTEMNVHDAVIDITNYVTHELGHPCHAFDYDKIMELGGMIVVKEAKKGKKFVTLDGAEYTTVGGEVVFENEKGQIIDLPAIKGTLNTSINESTKNVLFWIENLDAKKVRFASMTHAIRTVAAQLNEKHVDPALGEAVFQKGIELFQTLCDAQIASTVYDKFPGKKKPKTVVAAVDRIHEYLGVELPLGQIDKILTSLECEVELKAGKLHVVPPTFRPDIEIAADVVEEIARIYGYHNLPSVIMPTPIPLIKPAHTNFTIENRIKRFLADIGWQEVYTYSMVSEEIARQSGFGVDEHLKIQNALTDDRVYLRRTLIPSLEEVVLNNAQRKEMNVFEIANVYTPRKNDIPAETLHLNLVSTRPYPEVKGDMEALFERLFVEGYTVQTTDKTAPMYHQVAEIMAQKEGGQLLIGEIGVLKSGHVSIDLIVSELLKVVGTHPTYQPLPKTSQITEDLTFTVPAKTEVGPMIEKLRAVSPLISQVGLGGMYKQNVTLSFTFYDPNKHLTVEEIAPLRRQIVKTTTQQWNAQLVGKIE